MSDWTRKPIATGSILVALLLAATFGVPYATSAGETPTSAHDRGADDPIRSAGSDCGDCAEAKQVNGWCEKCGVGYVGGIPLHSRHLWHILDAHGHQLNIENLDCATCTSAAETDGYCTKSKIGFLDGDAYFSRLTWLLARAERQPLDTLDCPACRENFASSGWCGRCSVGRVGSRALADRQGFNDLVHDLEILVAANEASKGCEHCAVAIVTDTQCPFCRIRYKDGKPIP